jgi:hypothetical protein
MKSLDLGRHALCISLVAGALAACGGSSQPPMQTKKAPCNENGGGAVHCSAIATRPERGGSWMLPEASHEDLLYASLETTCCVTGSGNVYVFSYPQAKLVGALSVPFDTMLGLCSNHEGDVFVTGFESSDSGEGSDVYEYRHGQTKPIAELYDPWPADACSIDPVTGNLAVANWASGSSSPVIIYGLKGGGHILQEYYDSQIPWFRWCAYDANGNLYVDGQNGFGHVSLAVMLKGRHLFSTIYLNAPDYAPYSLQWYSNELVIAGYEDSIGAEKILEVRINGTKPKIVGTTFLKDYGHKWGDDSQFVIMGSRIVSGGYPGYYLHAWRFPEGGLPLWGIGRHDDASWYGVTISSDSGRNG